MAGKKQEEQELIEAAEYLSPDVKIDKEKGIIYGVKLVGLKSKHGYSYTDEALEEAARAGIYENVPVYRDHVDPKVQTRRPSSASLGKIIGKQTYKRGDGIYGDFRYLRTHPFMKRVLEAASDNFMSTVYGFSHHAYGKIVPESGQYLIKKIQKVRSVDLVAESATTGGIYEGATVPEEASVPNKKKVKAVLEGVYNKPEHKSILEGLGLTDDHEFEVEDTVIGDALTEAATTAVLAKAIADKKPLAKIMEGITALNKKPEVKPPAPAAPVVVPLVEGNATVEALQKRLTSLENEVRVRRLCESKKFTDVTPELVKGLSVLTDEEGGVLIEGIMARGAPVIDKKPPATNPPSTLVPSGGAPATANVNSFVDSISKPVFRSPRKNTEAAVV